MELKDVIVFLNAVNKHITLLLTGGALIAALGVTEHIAGYSLPWPIYSILLLILFMVACFMVWREEYDKYNNISERVKPKLKLRYS